MTCLLVLPKTALTFQPLASKLNMERRKPLLRRAPKALCPRPRQRLTARSTSIPRQATSRSNVHNTYKQEEMVSKDPARHLRPWQTCLSTRSQATTTIDLFDQTLHRQGTSQVLQAITRPCDAVAALQRPPAPGRGCLWQTRPLSRPAARRCRRTTCSAVYRRRNGNETAAVNTSGLTHRHHHVSPEDRLAQLLRESSRQDP